MEFAREASLTEGGPTTMAKGTITGATGDAATRPVRSQRFLTVAGGTLAALAVWAVAEWVVGLDLRTPAFSSEQPSQELTAVLVAAASAVGGLAGWGVLAVLERFTANPRRAWVAVAPIALLASLSAPLSGTGVSADDRIAMIGMHLAVAAVVIPLFYRSSAPRRDRTAL